jgi:hypothetical protein
MRAALRPSHYCDKHQPRWKNLARSKLLMALAVVLIPSALPAQSAGNSISAMTESASTVDAPQNYDPGVGNLTIEPEPIAAGAGLAHADGLPSEPSGNLERVHAGPAGCACFVTEQPSSVTNPQQGTRSTEGDSSTEGVKTSALIAEAKQRPDRNLDIYYRNRREFSLDVGWHPVNIPFIYDFAVGDNYSMTPLKYTLVPIIASLRWHVTNVGWPSILRGNMDFTFSGSITAIPRGPETHYYSFDFGIRRNFVYRNWKVVPFFEQRGGIGIINAKEPLGVLFAQGQNLTFTYDLGVGARYNLDSKYSFSAGMNYMHISNGYMSEPQFTNYGINVYGPMFGIDVRLGKPHHASQ